MGRQYKSICLFIFVPAEINKALVFALIEEKQKRQQNTQKSHITFRFGKIMSNLSVPLIKTDCTAKTLIFFPPSAAILVQFGWHQS